MLDKRSRSLLVYSHLMAGMLFLSPSYIRPDSIGVYSYLRSLVIDKDLLFFNEWAGFQMLGEGFMYFKEVSPVGALANHWWIGTAILQAPFYLASHFVSIILPGSMFPDDGFFGLDMVTLGWTAVLFHGLTLALALLVIGEEPADDFIGLAPLGEEVESMRPVGGHARGLARDGSDAGACPGHDRAHRKALRLHGDTDLAGDGVGGGDRERPARSVSGRAVPRGEEVSGRPPRQPAAQAP